MTTITIGSRVKATKTLRYISEGDTGTVVEIREQLILVAWDKDNRADTQHTRMALIGELTVID